MIVDEVGYIPFEPEAANLFFQLVSARYERASLIVTSNKPFGRWGEVFGDDVVAAAMIDRLVHHAEVISLKGDSYRLRNRGDLGRIPAAKPTPDHLPSERVHGGGQHDRHPVDPPDRPQPGHTALVEHRRRIGALGRGQRIRPRREHPPARTRVHLAQIRVTVNARGVTVQVNTGNSRCSSNTSTSAPADHRSNRRCTSSSAIIDAPLPTTRSGGQDQHAPDRHSKPRSRRGSVFKRRKGVSFQASLTWHPTGPMTACCMPTRPDTSPNLGDDQREDRLGIH